VSPFLVIGEIWTVAMVNLVVLAVSLRATTEKGRQFFSLKKSATPEKIPATLMCELD